LAHLPLGKNLFKDDPDADAVHVAVCFDEQMEMPFLALAESLRHSIKDRCRKLIIHAIYMGQLSESVSRLELYNTGNFVVDFVRSDVNFESLPKRSFVTDATYIRFMLPTLLNCVHRVLYLDADTIVVNDVSRLYDTDLHGLCVGAVIDRGTTLINVQLGLKIDRDLGFNRKFGDEINTYLRNVIGLKAGDEKRYFNAGVLLIDLGLWRTMGVTEAAIEYLCRNTNCIYIDQDALNAVLGTRYTQLDDRWNSLAICSYDYYLTNGSIESMNIVQKWRSDPWIVHYAGPNKPWRADRDRTPLDSYFWNAARKSFAYRLLKEMHYATTPPMSDYRATRKFIPTRTERLIEYCSKLACPLAKVPGRQ